MRAALDLRTGAPDTDRLTFLDFDGAMVNGRGRVVDPRSGEYTHLKDPPFGVAGGFGSFSYATSSETAYTFNHNVCRLDPRTLKWACFPLAVGAQTINEGVWSQMPSARESTGRHREERG